MLGLPSGGGGEGSGRRGEQGEREMGWVYGREFAAANLEMRSRGRQQLWPRDKRAFQPIGLWDGGRAEENCPGVE